ncbi:Alpha/Beta hydrolase protein [Chaetomium fimeti]|uniref:Alpha/Beta hydrolase protein n=1 Tax=Chaetomium fimeti TaxID=1854472 RepID=A0AAE0H5V2_9PEZI|nr:Alpha/Beta hydrolase protein [Chaetomium fimeti]
MADISGRTAAMEVPGLRESTNLITPPLPFMKRMKYSIIAFLWYRVLLKGMLYYGEAKKYFVPPGEKEPDLVKTYPVRKSLTIRIFFPPSYKPSTTTTTSSPQPPKLPTLLTIHGGGFTVGEPHDNDSWNRAFAQRHNTLVIALDYSKSPSGPFPTAIHDLEALIHCILADRTLPLDPARVAIAGFSAGGNFALAVTQLPSLRGRIRAAVPLYPLVVQAPTAAEGEAKAARRRYKPALGGFRGKAEDFLLPMMRLFNWSYLAAGQRCDDPLLSPWYAPRETLPKDIFFVACELDMLAHETWRMACKLSGRRVPGLGEKVGSQEVVGKGRLITEGDERFAFEETMEDGSRYRWLLVPDTIHGFDQDGIEGLAGDPVFMEDARIKTAKTIDLIGEWLLSGPLKGDSE